MRGKSGPELPTDLMPLKHLIYLCLAILVSGCATAPGPFSSQPSKMAQVRTTAYTHTERSHIRYGKMSASGETLSSGRVRSAAADWSRFPVGTKFRIRQTGQVYQVDDYGSALIGTSTIDLYVPTTREMNRWGVRFVDIDILRWGSREISLKILEPRTRHKHVRAMVNNLRAQGVERSM